MKSLSLLTLVLLTCAPVFSPHLSAQGDEDKGKTEPVSKNTIEVEVKVNVWKSDEAAKAGDPLRGAVDRKLRVQLSYVTYNKDKSLFVGYYQDGWFEMVSLHDAKTKDQLGSVYIDGGVPTLFRFSNDNKFLGAKGSVGWYVWKIPSFDKIFVLEDVDFDGGTPSKEEAGIKTRQEAELAITNLALSPHHKRVDERCCRSLCSLQGDASPRGRGEKKERKGCCR